MFGVAHPARPAPRLIASCSSCSIGRTSSSSWPSITCRTCSPGGPPTRASFVPRSTRIHPSGATAAYDAVVNGSAAVRTPQPAARGNAHHLGRRRHGLRHDDPGRPRNALLRSDAFVYAIAIDARATRPSTPASTLRHCARSPIRAAGGPRWSRRRTDLQASTARIAEELSTSICLAMCRHRAPTASYHSIRVRVKDTEYRVRARNGYVRGRRLETRLASAED